MLFQCAAGSGKLTKIQDLFIYFPFGIIPMTHLNKVSLADSHLL